MIINTKQLEVFKRNAYITNSKVVKFPTDLYEDIMLLTASCGRGKTHFALSIGDNGLLAEINRILYKNNILDRNYQHIQPQEVLFLTSRKAIASQQLQKAQVLKAIPADFQSDFIDLTGERQGKILVTTAHSFGEWVRQGMVERPPKLIIIDEIHSIFSETIFADSLLYTLEYVKEHYNEMVKIGLTATPHFLLEYVTEADCSFHFSIVDIDLGAKYKAQKIKALKNGSIQTVLKQYRPTIGSNNKAIVYTMSAKECYRLAAEHGERAAFLISDYNETEINGKKLVDIMNEAGVKQYILENECLPDNIDVIFINSACREGMNIKDTKVQLVICEAVDLITIEQILGRIRGNIEEFMVVCNFHNYDRVNKNIEELAAFLRDLAAADTPRDKLIERYGRQEENRHLQRFVFKYNDEYLLNSFAKAYLQYIQESYYQISNYEGRYIQSVGDRNLLLCEDYLRQLCRYAEDNTVVIDMIWSAAKEKNHENAVAKFQKIEKDWLDKPLGTAEKKALCAELACMRQGGKKAGWNTVKDLLESAGYEVTDKRTSKARFTVITKK